MSVTIREVARLANVSVGTVSRVLNGHPSVSAENAERVQRVIGELQYKRQRVPESTPFPLKDKNIALILLGMNRSLAALPSVADAMHGAEAAVNEAGANLLLADVPLADRLPAAMERNRIDAVLLKGALVGNLFAGGSPELFDRLQKLPTVWFLGRPDGGDWGDVVQSNDRTVGKLAADHLIAKGHRHVAVLNPKPDHVTFRQREASFTWHAKRAGAVVDLYLARSAVWDLPLRPVDQVELVDGLVDELLAARPRPTAAFVPGDSVTAMVYRALSKRGLRVGRDLSLVSCNNESPMLTGLYPTPTTIDIHAAQVGRRAVDQLAWRLNHVGDAAVDIGIEPSLTEGQSVAAL
ncbi:MAG: LacI family DNA-binding transcriptional regulator [Gemmataceae bacterium]